ncbi:MAG: D-arabinono-1,4-lactone oxidase [Trebonia sp.]
MTITNWAGNVTFTATDVLRPQSAGELQAIVSRTPKLRVLGAGHSFSPVADSPAMVTLDGMPAEVEIDSARATARVSAGLSYGELARGLDARGFALANLASLPHITVAGAVATGTHGSGSGNGALATAVAGIDMITAEGDPTTIGPGETSGAVVALGALGVVTSLELTLVPAFAVRQWVYENLPRGELDTRFAEIFASAYSVSVFTTWRDPGNLDQVFVKHRADDGWTAPGRWLGAQLADGQRNPVPGMPPGYTTPQGGAEGPWHERLPHFLADFTPSAGDELQTEYLVPRDQAVAALAALDDLAPQIAEQLLVCELRTVSADDYWLSPCYGRDTAAFHFTWRKDPAAVTALLPAIKDRLAPFDPRPHWGKVFTLPPDRIAASYPRMAAFRRLMAAHDPDGKFRNAFIDRVIALPRSQVSHLPITFRPSETIQAP